MAYEKRKIEIKVDPRYAAYARVMTTISFRSLVDFIETESKIKFTQSDIENMQEAMEDLFEGVALYVDPQDIDRYMKPLAKLSKLS